ncbi:uncharacterized protein [Spinacia oleracea]|uniref:Uncharacterized protein isoform X2 n=1 Tax=Spinacia oleracea TaxID=3562 RepID=A0A9R0IQM5_SPIOL|nr:uncharacterized protein LOC110793235 isoform X2 [Spinacia oleracea]
MFIFSCFWTRNIRYDILRILQSLLMRSWKIGDSTQVLQRQDIFSKPVHSRGDRRCSRKMEQLFLLIVGLDSVQVKGHISMSYRTWQANNKGSRKSLRWKKFICSREPEMLECCYYVMKYMYQIVLLGLQSISNVEEIFSPNPYTQEEIDDVREKWSRYFISSL